MNRYLIFLLALALLLAGCSSLRRPLQPQAKVNADNALKLAQDHEQQRRFTNSEDSYTYALELYRSFADLSGQMHCLAGLHRIGKEKYGTASSSYYYLQMADIVRLVDPSQEPILVLANLYSLMNEGNYPQVAAKAVIKASYSPIEKMQILSYRVQADAFLGEPNEGRVRELARLAGKHLRKPLRKREVSPQVVSAATYALAYHHYLQKDFTKSLGYLKHAREVDYTYGNFVSLGFDYWLEGKNYRALSDPEKAITAFWLANDIFGATANVRMRDKCELELRELRAQATTE